MDNSQIENALARLFDSNGAANYLVLIHKLTFLDSRYQPSALGFQ